MERRKFARAVIHCQAASSRLKHIALALMFYGLFGFFLGFACDFFGPQMPACTRDYQFPLGNPVDVVADQQGRIFVGLAFYGRVQVYDREGQFLYGFFVTTSGGLFRLQIDDANHTLTVASTRGNRLVTTTLDGVRIGTANDVGHLFDSLEARPQIGFVDTLRRRYKIHHAVLWPSVERTDADGQRPLKIKSPPYFWLIDGPLLSLVTAFAFRGALSICNLRGKRQMKMESGVFSAGRDS